jgi:hypothetical protein
MRQTNAYLDEIDEDDGPWFCLVAKPYYCPDCEQVQKYLHIKLPQQQIVAIVVFDEKDDPHLLEMAITWQERNKNPKIVKYNPNFGLCISLDDVMSLLGVNDE